MFIVVWPPSSPLALFLSFLVTFGSAKNNNNKKKTYFLVSTLTSAPPTNIA
jgi:hypothetical protein